MLSHRLEIAGSQAFVNAVDREEVTVRVHWLPYWCDNTILEKGFNKYGQVLKIDDEKGVTLDKEGAHIASAVRIVTLVCKDDTKHHIPHIVKIEGKDVLLTIRGRLPMCLKCKKQDILDHRVTHRTAKVAKSMVIRRKTAPLQIHTRLN